MKVDSHFHTEVPVAKVITPPPAPLFLRQKGLSMRTWELRS